MIRKAHATEHRQITEIAFRSKKTWNYPDKYFNIWKGELTVTPEYLAENKVFVYEEQETIKGFFSIVENKREKYISNIFVEKGFWMDHLFVLPAFQKQGIGTALFNFSKEYCKYKGITDLLVFVDPNAANFYKRMGAEFVRNSPSSIPGRWLPVYKILV